MPTCDYQKIILRCFQAALTFFTFAACDVVKVERLLAFCRFVAGLAIMCVSSREASFLQCTMLTRSSCTQTCPPGALCLRYVSFPAERTLLEITHNHDHGGPRYHSCSMRSLVPPPERVPGYTQLWHALAHCSCCRSKHHSLL